MAVYAAGGQLAALTTTLKTAIAVFVGATLPRRLKFFDINVSQGGSPASTDTNIEFDFTRVSAATAGTGTALVPVKADPADGPCIATSKVNFTIEPTVYDDVTGLLPMFQIYLNQRAPYRWQTYLGSGAELVVAATASVGAGLRTQSLSYTGGAGGTLYFVEQ